MISRYPYNSSAIRQKGKIWRTLFFCNTFFEIRPFAFLLTNYYCCCWQTISSRVEYSFCVTRTFSKVEIRDNGKGKYLYQWDRRQPSNISEFKQNNWFLFPLKSSESHRYLWEQWKDVSHLLFKADSKDQFRIKITIQTANLARLYLTFTNIISFCSPWNHQSQKTIGFLMISGETEVNQFVEIHLILEVKFGNDP